VRFRPPRERAQSAFKMPEILAHCVSTMRSWRHRIAGAAFALLVTAISWPPAQAAECALKPTVTVTDTQGGFAGTTGNVWTIRPDCTFTVARIINERVSAPHLQGRLTAAQQARLSTVLANMSAATLPAQIGERAIVNPRQITLSYDDKTSVLELAPGESDIAALKALRSSDPARRHLEISEAVKMVTGSGQ
jgi:hypothetical protein